MKSTHIAALVLALVTAASVAFGVPALMRRAHADEAILNLSKLTRIADVYYVKPKAGADGERMICQFPAGTIRSTLAKSCCDPEVTLGDGQCDPAKIEWNRSLWKTLRFQLDEPHWFVYEFKSTGTLGNAQLEVSAYGDSDCDGEYSTFRFVQSGGSTATVDNCVLTTQATYQVFSPDE